MSVTGLKVSTTKLVRIDLDAKVCRRYSGREETHGFLFDEEKQITPKVIGVMLEQPEAIATVEAEAA